MIAAAAIAAAAVTAAAAVSACVRCHDRQPRGTGSHGSYLREYSLTVQGVVSL